MEFSALCAKKFAKIISVWYYIYGSAQNRTCCFTSRREDYRGCPKSIGEICDNEYQNAHDHACRNAYGIVLCYGVFALCVLFARHRGGDYAVARRYGVCRARVRRGQHCLQLSHADEHGGCGVHTSAVYSDSSARYRRGVRLALLRADNAFGKTDKKARAVRGGRTAVRGLQSFEYRARGNDVRAYHAQLRNGRGDHDRRDSANADKRRDRMRVHGGAHSAHKHDA